MSNPGKTSAYAPDRSYDSNDALESRFAPRNPQRFPGFRFAEVLLIGYTLDYGPRILESGRRGRQRFAFSAKLQKTRFQDLTFLKLVAHTATVPFLSPRGDPP